MKDFFFKPYQADSNITIKSLSEIFDSNGIPAAKSLLLARYLVEPQKGGKIVYNQDLSAS